MPDFLTSYLKLFVQSQMKLVDKVKKSMNCKRSYSVKKVAIHQSLMNINYIEEEIRQKCPPFQKIKRYKNKLSSAQISLRSGKIN